MTRTLTRPPAQLSPCRTGNLYATMAVAAYEQAGQQPWMPIGDGTAADFVATDGGLAAGLCSFERVQIKAARYLYRDRQPMALIAAIRNPTGMLRVAQGRGRDALCYRRDEIDAFALVTPDGRVFRLTADDLIPVGSDAYPTTVTLRLIPSANGQTKGIRLASAYELHVPDALRALMPAVAAGTIAPVGTRTRKAA